MKMCYNAYDLSFAINAAVFSFLLMIYSTLLFADEAYSETIMLPLKSDDVKEALLLGLELESGLTPKNIRKRDHSSNTAWFGPRLGRKKRSVSLDDEVLEILDDRGHKNNVDDDLKIFKSYPLNFPILVEGYVSKRQLMKPRLGRGNTWSDDDEKMVKAPPFSPRLGRRSMVPLKPRLGRAGSPETAVFKPRLGRDPNFNEFGEYADTTNGIDYKDH